MQSVQTEVALGSARRAVAEAEAQRSALVHAAMEERRENEAKEFRSVEPPAPTLNISTT